ncbi:MAG: amino acid permease [Oscillospiraceae bacterium]|nr:amino acid permease [Oscillospiraceae bacterium]
MNNGSDSGQTLHRTLEFRDIIILAFSTMIGWGWVSLTGTWVTQGGTLGASIAFVLGAILCIFVGLAYCELTPMLPYAGGELVFSYRAMGYHASWFTGWMISFAYLGVAAWEGPALATAMDHLFSIPRAGYLFTVADFPVYLSWLIIPAAVGMLLVIINYRGIHISALFQAIVTAILALGGVIFAVISAVKGNSGYAEPLFTGTKGVFTVLLAVPSMFVGFDVIPQAAEEMKVPLFKIPKAIIASICLAASWYIVMILSAAFSAPRDVLAGEGLSVVNAIGFSTGGRTAGILIVVTAVMGILTSWNGFIIGATRVLYSMGRAGMLPSVFGTLHPKYRTPYFATAFVGIITIFTPLLGRNSLGWFVDASAFGTVIAYFMVALSFVVLRKREPDTARPFMVKYGMAVGIIAMLVAVFFIVLYLPVGSSSLNKQEWIIVFSWAMLGVILYLHSLRGRNMRKEERERAIYGK